MNNAPRASQKETLIFLGIPTNIPPGDCLGNVRRKVNSKSVIHFSLERNSLPEVSHARCHAPTLLSAQIGSDSSQGGIKSVAPDGGQGCLHCFIGRDHFYLCSLALQTLSLLLQAFR